jgi:hypothetical protein
VRRTAILAAVVCAFLALVTAPAQAAAASVSVLSFNLWQLPWIANPNTSDKAARA